MPTIARPLHNIKDSVSVSLVQVHNLGAGGVTELKTTDRAKISHKRLCQHFLRNARSIGIRPESYGIHEFL